MKKTFTFEYDDEGSTTLSYSLSMEQDEKLDSSVQNGIPFLFLNPPAMIQLAKILIKMASGSYKGGFHLHLYKDFDPDLPERLVVLLSSSDKDGQKGLE